MKNHVSLREIPSREVLQHFSLRASNPNEAARLEALAANYEAYNTWRSDEPGLVDVLRQFPSLRLNSAELVFRLPSLQPR